MTSQTLVIGANPAGLTAAYELSGCQYGVSVLEASGSVGGLYRTEGYQGYRIDWVDSPLSTQMNAVEQFWRGLLPTETVEVKRRSLIYFHHRLFNYPLSFTNAFKHLGPTDIALTGLSYLKNWFARQQVSPTEARTAEDWINQRFGPHLHRIFFDSYFEKVWGCRGEQLAPSCASQLLRKPAAQAVTYPALGGSQLWEACRDRLVQNGASVCLSTQAVRLEHMDNRITQAIALKNGTLQTFPVDHLISSLSLLELVTQLNAPSDVQQAARCLKYRHIAQVALILNKANLFVEQDIYVQCPEVFVSRIQNFKNWGEARMGDSDKTCLGLTYFCDASDALWQMGEDELVCLASQELVDLGLVETLEQVEAGTVMRQHQAVPVETPETFRHRAIVLEYCDHFKNLQTIGRDGLHCHTRLETDILSGQSAAENIVSGRSASAFCRLTGDRTGRSFHAQSTVHRAL